ncbi:deoxyribonuclease-1-like [Chanos chanos]|uniref:Deoxyribonuclease n=1 Tax=Chanos chanos TaxID=29144 RepID=A0A6J2WQF9_CHACN|nr:deoxyribonuclease-1-like [Chanos chanos]
MKIVVAIALFLTFVEVESSLLIGAFNIQSFGDTKASNSTLLDIITKIVHRYDIVLIQEVRDSDLNATRKLMENLNKGTTTYEYTVSEPLGPSTYKERYLFIYRAKEVSVEKSYLYGGGKFTRQPFIVMFSSTSTVVRNFVLVPQHTRPQNAVEEIDALYDVVADIRSKWKTNDTLLMGDLNAGCTYVRNSDWSKIRLFTDKSFHWLIPNTAITTVSPTTACPYDRIVSTNYMMRGVASGSAKVFDFQRHLGLSQELALAVSDHFPVEVRLK